MPERNPHITKQATILTESCFEEFQLGEPIIWGTRSTKLSPEDRDRDRRTRETPNYYEFQERRTGERRHPK